VLKKVSGACGGVVARKKTGIEKRSIDASWGLYSQLPSGRRIGQKGWEVTKVHPAEENFWGEKAFDKGRGHTRVEI